MSDFREGDWYCGSCKNHNFARRTECKQCNAPKGAEAAVVVEPEAKVARTKEPAGPPTYYLAVDIERVGADFKYGILAIGACFGKSDGTVIEQRAFCSPVPEVSGFDKECWESFWCKFPEVLARINAEAIPDHIRVFHAWLLELEKKYGPFGRKHVAQGGPKMKLLSDNPAYDIGMINLEFYKEDLPRPMAEMWSDYVPTDDPTEQMRALTPEQTKRVKAYVNVPHDHYPANDATEIFQLRVGLEAVLSE